MFFLFVFKKILRDLVQQCENYKLPKCRGENCGSAAKNVWGWGPLSARTAGAERLIKSNQPFTNTQRKSHQYASNCYENRSGRNSLLHRENCTNVQVTVVKIDLVTILDYTEKITPMCERLL